MELGTRPIKERRLSKKEKNDLIYEKASSSASTRGDRHGERSKDQQWTGGVENPRKQTVSSSIVWRLNWRTGKGKTKFAVVFGVYDNWMTGGALKWFERPTGQSTAIFDGLRTGSCAVQLVVATA